MALFSHDQTVKTDTKENVVPHKSNATFQTEAKKKWARALDSDPLHMKQIYALKFLI